LTGIYYVKTLIQINDLKFWLTLA